MDFKKLVVAVFVLACAVLLVLFALLAYPVPGGDSGFFLVPALQLANAGVLTNPLFINEQAMRIIDPSGQKRFLFNPPLYPLLLNHGMIGASPWDIFLSIAILSSLVIGASALALYRMAARVGSLTWPALSAVLLALLALASGLVGSSGRPEILASLWVALGILVFLHGNRRHDWILFGFLGGLMLSTHLVSGILALLVLGALFAARYQPRETLARFSGAALVELLTFTAVVSLGPFGVWETVRGAVINASQVSSGYAEQFSNLFTPSQFLHYYFLSPATPFYGLVVLLVFVSSVFFYRRYRVRIVSPFLFKLAAVGLVLAVGSILYSVGHVFYLVAFAPLLFLGFLRYFWEGGAAPKVAVLVVLALVATGIVRIILLFPVYLQATPTLSEARGVFRAASQQSSIQGLRIGVTGSFWTLSEDYDRMYLYNTYPEKPREDTALIFFQQRYSGLRTPPEIAGCVLIENRFSSTPPHVLGVPLGNTMPGYAYAAYQCSAPL